MQLDVLLEQPADELRSHDRVRLHTPPRINDRLDEAMMKRIWVYASKTPCEITTRIEELDREWDLERVLETGAGLLALTGVALSGVKGRRWLLLSASVLALLLQHAVTRQSVPMQLLRQAGFRTRREIDAEKYAMRMLRGDFDRLKPVGEGTHRAIEALRLNRP